MILKSVPGIGRINLADIAVKALGPSAAVTIRRCELSVVPRR